MSVIVVAMLQMCFGIADGTRTVIIIGNAFCIVLESLYVNSYASTATQAVVLRPPHTPPRRSPLKTPCCNFRPAGRAGTKGRATSFYTDRDGFLVQQIKQVRRAVVCSPGSCCQQLE